MSRTMCGRADQREPAAYLGGTTTASTPTITGPITGGASGRPFGGLDDPASRGYSEHEYFLEGTATRYGPRPGTELGLDGKWDAVPVESAPYKTRVVVYRPLDSQAFNGTVIVSWNNVSAGSDMYQVDSPQILEGGFAYAAVTVQVAGVRGVGDRPMGLVQVDPERYGSLSITSDDYGYDIYTQAARCVARDRTRQPIDVLDGLDVRHVVALGGSQSAGRVAAYFNAVQPLENVFDAFFPYLYFGAGAPLEMGDVVWTPRMVGDDEVGGGLPGTPCRLRDDLDARVLVVNSEVEAIACFAVRQPDTDRFRCWEVAGTAHMTQQAMSGRLQGAGGTDLPSLCEVAVYPVVEAAYRHLQVWLETGTPPPTQPRIDFAGDPPEVVRDEHGIARGGIRLPAIDVPLATNGAQRTANPLSFLGGSCVRFPADKVRALYGDADTYLSKFEERTRAAEKAGVVLARDAEALLEEARTNAAEAFDAN